MPDALSILSAPSPGSARPPEGVQENLGAARRFLVSRRLLALVLVVLLPALVLLAHAKEARPASDNPELEARVLAIAQELRCLVCQNETIAASHADLAVDLRQQIRLKLQAGQSKQQIVGFMVDRYGEFVLYRPPLEARTALLWLGPFALLVVALLTLAIHVRRRRRAALAAQWSEAQALRARALFDDAPGQS